MSIYLNPQTGESIDTDTAEGAMLFDNWSQSSVTPVQLSPEAAQVVSQGQEATGVGGAAIQDRPVDVSGPGAVWNKQSRPVDPEVGTDTEETPGVQEEEKLTGDELDARASELDIEGRSGMTADEKREAIAEAEAAEEDEDE